MATHTKSGTATGGPALTTGEEASTARWNQNRDLRIKYLDILEAIAKADSDNDDVEAGRLRKELDAIGGQFYVQNKGLAGTVAKTFLGQSPSNGDDYMAAAALGLWEAFLTWDPHKGVTFGTYSRNYIKGRVARTVRKYEYSHMGQGDFNRRTDVRNTRDRLAKELDRTPTIEEIASDLGISQGVVERALRAHTISLDSPVGTDEGSATFGDLYVAGSDGQSEADEDVTANEDVLEELTDLELWIVLARKKLIGNDDEVSLVEIADTIGLGRESVRRASECAELRIQAVRFARENERNPSWDELLAFAERDTGAAGLNALKSAYALGADDLQRRWLRARTSLDQARRSGDAAKAEAARKRMDRIGEEALGQHRGLVAMISDRHQGDAHPGEPVPLTACAALVWNCILTWTPEDGTITAYAKRNARKRWSRREGTEVAKPTDADVTRWWAHIRTRITELR